VAGSHEDFLNKLTDHQLFFVTVLVAGSPHHVTLRVCWNLRSSGLLFTDVNYYHEVSATSWSLLQRSPTECCVLSGRGLCDELVPVQRSPTECGVSKIYVIVKPRKMRRPRPPRGCRAIGKKKTITTRRRVIPQKTADLINIAAEAWDQNNINIIWHNVLRLHKVIRLNSLFH
jgi:hypothetical protein